LAHESFQPKSPEVLLATQTFSSVRPLAFGPPIFSTTPQVCCSPLNSRNPSRPKPQTRPTRSTSRRGHVPARAEPIEAHPAPATSWTPPESSVPMPGRPCRARQACALFNPRASPLCPSRVLHPAALRATPAAPPPPCFAQKLGPPPLTAVPSRFRPHPPR
jgi:hypothetical protein